MQSNRVVGIMGAMPEEIEGIKALLTDTTSTIIGKRRYISGMLNGVKTVLVFSRWGKVAASATAATLINVFNVTELIFTGVAGAVHTNVAIGDIVIGKRLIQHDIDARPIMQRFEIPLLGKTYIEANAGNVSLALSTITNLLENNILSQNVGKEVLSDFGITRLSVHVGDIASGDKFFATNDDKEKLTDNLPETLCVEMEGAAVAQVCYEYDIPFTVIRIISDAADDASPIDFPVFIKNVSSKYIACIVKALIN
ncbi:5'-methylthioadenosine/S-adenosylhomocysteine nucleosidase [Flavobacterium suaedae]|uniref:adenosylhomocysteine nucleosidase n=1 Tax=Flavobacterium suaedae TaxID=1767027 RepID=A0ABQ1JIR5_9FLAO|nr:5'-methylthioadenosine/adenosylhomocysteine nucleosidase [Flavobacterium suaedae]GGB67307.1 5'-methylthioadenosine/S-adenosylhomocysteine nucleosidase [Flavobacterium suaedae]